MDLTRGAVRALAAASALTLLLAACGDDDSDSSEGTDQTTEAAADAGDETTTTEAEDEDETTTTEAGDEPEDGDETTTTEAGTVDEDGAEGDADAVALAQRINLTIDDFDEGWTDAEPQPQDGEPSIDDCFVETDIEAATVGEAETGTFSYEPSGDEVQLVTMQTVVLDSPETAEAIYDEFSGEAFAPCAADIMTGGFGEGATADLALRPDDPAWTEQSTGLVGDVGIPDGDTSYSGVVDLHIFRTAEVVSFTATIDVGIDGIEALLGQIYPTVGDRHAAEVG